MFLKMYIRGVTYNIMAQRYINNTSNPSSIPAWNERLLMICSKVPPNIDIICLQEVELADVKEIINYFRNYDYIVHELSKKRTNVIGNITFYNKDTLSMITSDSNSCAVFGTFLHLETNKEFWLINLHLRAGLRSKQNERKSQLNSCLKKVNKNIPGILCGDFNDDFIEPNIILKQIIDKENLTCNELGTHITCCVYEKTLSHSFYQFDHVIANNLSIHIKGCSEPTVIPNEIEPSDHYPVEFVVFEST